MVGNWDKAPLDALVDEIVDRRGVTPTKLGSSFVSSGHRVISAKVVKSGRIDLCADEARFVDEPTYQKWMRTPLRADDVILTSEAPLGQVAYMHDQAEWCLGQRLFAIRPRKATLHGRYLFYALQAPNVVDDLHSRATGTTVLGIRQTELRRVSIPVPPLHVQRAIASVLGALDDKIDLNRRTNETLEAMARALFKSWFVDFDPVRAKAEGAAPAGMDAETAKLFPSELVDSELGPVPKGWRASTLGAEVHRCGGAVQTGPFGSQLHASDYVPQGVPVIMPKDIAGRRVSTASIARIREHDAERLSRHRLEVGDVVYSRRGDVERHALIGQRERGWLCGTGCLLVRLGAGWPSPVFASFALDRPETRAWISQHAIGATMPNLNTGILSSVPVLMPPDALLEAFGRIVEPLQRLIVTRDAEIGEFASLRDALLPRLLSGELSALMEAPPSLAVERRP